MNWPRSCVRRSSTWKPSPTSSTLVLHSQSLQSYTKSQGLLTRYSSLRTVQRQPHPRMQPELRHHAARRRRIEHRRPKAAIVRLPGGFKSMEPPLPSANFSGFQCPVLTFAGLRRLHSRGCLPATPPRSPGRYSARRLRKDGRISLVPTDPNCSQQRARLDLV